MEKEIPFQVEGVIISDRSMAHGGRQFKIETYENLAPDKVKRLIELEGKPGWFTFNTELIESVDLINLPKIDKTRYPEGKSPSQRLRAVLYLLHKQKGGKEKDWPMVYETNMEKLIAQFKDQLD